MKFSILPEHDLPLQDIDTIEDRIYEYNQSVTGKCDARGLAFLIRDEADRIVAACAGYSWADSSELKLMWVDQGLRGRGYGRDLLNAYLAEATNRGVKQVWVASYDFQAPEFYERAGFKREAEFRDWPPGHSNIILRKPLSWEAEISEAK